MSVESHALIDLVFSWSINDAINNNLYKDKVRTIPYVFSSETEYLESFIAPLIEETRADLLSSLTTLSNAPSLEIGSIKRSKEYNLPKDLFYEIEVRKGVEDGSGTEIYEPEVGDFVAISSVKPQCVSDLDRPERSYLIANVKRVKESADHFTLLILLSKPSLVDDDTEENKSRTLFAVKLINITTNVRIWNSLHSDRELANRRIIRNVLQTDFPDTETCSVCGSGERYGSVPTKLRAELRASDLNESQRDAILSCVRTRDCSHLNTVKMIWGPPGTGKTKTVGFLLHLLLTMECRTLACAPTNTAVLQVTKRLVHKVKGSAEFETYGLGDVVLFGNRKRMKIDDSDELHDVFLEHRVDVLNKCLCPRSGWKDALQTMIGLLAEPEKLYDSYLRETKGKSSEKDDDENEENCLNFGNIVDVTRNLEKGDGSDKAGNGERDKRRWKQVIVKMVRDNRKNNKPKRTSYSSKEKKPNEDDEEKINVTPLSFDKFVKKSFSSIGERLCFFVINLYTHLPTSVISLEVVKNMLKAVDSLESFEPLLNDVPGEDLREAYGRGSCFTRFNAERVNSLFLLESLPSTFPVPWSPDKRLIREFCLGKACLIFCTVSGSAKLHIIDMAPMEMLVVDEAAQLKECESTIPLQLHGIRHAVLVGDERQLPAMVRSQIADEAQFGRSLYERLAFLEHKKHLLNVQYRMHPSISLFPNREFYRNQSLDGPNVKGKSYNRRFLRNKFFNSYSFINVSHSKEEFDDKRSRKNIAEVAVVTEVVASLHREFNLTRKKVTVGVISPYKAQVHEIASKIVRYTTNVHRDFCVSVRTVDGFQGGEEDVIIISTVRCNGIGSISFLASHQRVNVALTRARYCLWIVGSGTTLSNSGTFWKSLVADARERGCFHDAAEDKNLTSAITLVLLENNQVSVLRNLDSLLFNEAKWKVHIADPVWRSLTRFRDYMLCKKVFNLLDRIANGGRRPDIRSNQIGHNGPSSELIEYYTVNTHQYLVCTVDIMKEASHYIQILKIWDILHQSDMLELSSKLDRIYGGYSADKISLCKYKCRAGDLLVPMRWPVDSSITETNACELISKQLLSVSLKNIPDTSSTDERNFVVPMRGTAESSCDEADPLQLLSKSMDSSSLKHKPRTLSTINMHIFTERSSSFIEYNSVKLSSILTALPESELETSLSPKQNLVLPQRSPVVQSYSEADPIVELSRLMSLLSLKEE